MKNVFTNKRYIYILLPIFTEYISALFRLGEVRAYMNS